MTGARITLEKGGTPPYAITCGIYGALVHTRFFDSEPDAQSRYELMKTELERILHMGPLESDPDGEAKMDAAYAAVSDFVERFP